MKLEDVLYEEKFGQLPNNQADRIEYILQGKQKNEKFKTILTKSINKFRRIKYKTLTFTMWKVVRPSARPRANASSGFIRMYVPRAKDNAEWFKEFANRERLPFIDTPCILNIKIYEKTPSGYSILNKVLAEMGYIRPWKRTGDFDNYAKSIADALQHGVLSDDCLVIDSRQQLFYSIKPHVDVELKWMEKLPEY